jgi:hypothetical protein
MRRTRCSGGLAAAAFATSVAAPALGEPAAAIDYSTTASVVPKATDAPAPPAGLTPVEKQATGKGFVFHPSRTELGAFRFAIGAFYDAIDPAVMYGFNVRVPQLTLDARYGLGSGWAIKGHFNSMFVTTELLLGAGYAARFGDWSVEGDMSVGIYVGQLAEFGFDATMLSPEYRPELTLGYDFGNIAFSLRASLLLMGPERVRVGDVWGGLDNSNAFVGHSEMLYVENTTHGNGVWYFGVGAMTTRSYYALWLLFPDTPGLFTYPRVVAGYEF